jgi:hypothetical protein
MRSGWHSEEGKDFCLDFKMQQSFSTVLDTDAYDDEEARTLNAAWCERMNFWFYKNARRRLTGAEVRRAAANYTESQELLDLEADGGDEVRSRIQQIRAIRPQVSPSGALAAPSPPASPSASSSSSSSSTGGL